MQRFRNVASLHQWQTAPEWQSTYVLVQGAHNVFHCAHNSAFCQTYMVGRFTFSFTNSDSAQVEEQRKF